MSASLANHASRVALERSAVALERRLTGRKTTTLAVVGAAKAEGATTTSIGLAYALSRRSGRRVVLVEGDNVHPSLLDRVRPLGAPAEASVVESPLTSCVGITAVSDTLTCCGWTGPVTRAESHALLGDVLRKTSAIVAGCDLIMIDLPPVLEDAESAVLAGASDATLFVAAAARRPARLHRTALDELRLHEANVIGLLFNRRRDRIPSWLIGGRG